MSLLLDALKKSERERKERTIPDLQTSHAEEVPPRRNYRLWWIVVAVILINGAGWWGWTVFQTDDTASAPTASPVASEPKSQTQAASPPKVERRPPPQRPSRTLRPAQQAQPPVTRPGVEVRPQTEAPPVTPAPPARGSQVVLTLEELPGTLRQEAAGYELSMHFYAPEPAARLVRLNGQLLREGQRLDSGAVVQEIRPDGVVLERSGYQFLLPGRGGSAR